MAGRGTAALAGALRDSGAERADGFSLNVSNFATTADNQAYGDAVSAALGDKQYLIDVSRNGRGAPDAVPRASTPGATLRVSPWVRTRGSGPTARSPWDSCGSRSPARRTGTAATANRRPERSGPTTRSA